MGILHTPGIRRVVGFCVCAATAVVLAAVPATPASAAESNGLTGRTGELVITSVFVNNPGSRSFADTEEIRIQMTAQGGTLPYTWSATGLSGSKLSINPSTGLISGPLLNWVGSWTVTVTATAAAGGSGSTTFGISVFRECRTC
jgi:hypothetical protein